MSAPLTFHLLGGASLGIGDNPLKDLRSRTAEALLIYLACQDRPLSREFLADFFWDDRSQEQAAANLRSILSTLRKQVGEWLIIDRQEVAFNRQEPYWLDTAVFEAQINVLQPYLNDSTPLTETTAQQLEAALAHYRGDFLAGFHLNESRGFEEWIVVRRERLRRLAVLGLRQLVDYHLAAGRYPAGLTYVERLVEADPYNEAAQRQKMWLLARSDSRNAALQSYLAFKKLLAADLSVEPAPATRAVYERIGRLSFPPPNNLALLPTPFVGREAEIKALVADLLRPAGRLISLVGPGGVGKTTLATQVGLQMSAYQPGYFLEGIWFVPLASVHSARFMATATANALGLTLKGTVAPRDQLLNYLKERELLLILDNLEQLLVADEAVLGLIHDILAQAPGVRLLVTSRERLNLRAEQIFDIDGLPYPAAVDIEPETAVQYSAVALFVQSARRMSRLYEPDAADIQAIVQLCQLLEGVPLGLEMAAAWIRTGSVPDILAQLRQSFTGLATTWRDVPERHRSLRAVFDHSWELLTAEEQRGFARLAVFRGGFSPTAAQIVAGVASPAPFLGKSLLRQGKEGRYDLHSLIQQFTAEILGRDGADYESVRHKHADYYLQLLQQQEKTLNSETADAARERVAREIENIRLAWGWALEQGQLALLNLAYLALYQFYEMQGWLDEGREHFKQTTTVLRKRLGDLAGVPEETLIIFGRLYSREGWFTYRVGEIDRASEIFEECEQLFRGLADKKDLAQALNDRGLLARRRGNYEMARQFFLEALALRRELNDRTGVAIGLNNLANAVRFLGEFEQAGAYLLESLALLQTEGNLVLLANVTNDLGETHRATGNYGEARTYFEDSLAIRQKIGVRPGIAMCLNNLGSVAHTLGDYEGARRYAEGALAVDIETGDKRAMPYPLSVLARIARDEGDFERAFASFRRALQVCHEINYLPKSLDIFFELATVYEAMGQPVPAARLLRVVIDHPKINYETRQAALEMMAEMVELLSPEIAQRIEEQSREDTFDSLKTAVLRGQFG